MLLTILPKLTLWLSWTGLGYAIETDNDILFRSVRFTMTRRPAPKSTKTTGLSSATPDVRVADSTSPRHFQIFDEVGEWTAETTKEADRIRRPRK